MPDAAEDTERMSGDRGRTVQARFGITSGRFLLDGRGTLAGARRAT
jgi:hypothetical protein